MAVRAKSLELSAVSVKSARRKRLRQAFEGWLFIAPVMIGVLACYFVPIVVSLYVSLTNWHGLAPARRRSGRR